MFAIVAHADWSARPAGRWVATARRRHGGWQVAPPVPVGDLDRFRIDLLGAARDAPVLAGFDFPIGVPKAYGERTGLPGFRKALEAFGVGEGWADFYRVATTADEISVGRPFFPAGSGTGERRKTLVDALHLASDKDLLRACEQGGDGRRRASPLFWTVGAAQVGRAATVGWQQVVAPALREGASLWPFDGTLAELAGRGGLVIAETYPADASATLGAAFRPRQSKRRQSDRRGKAEAVLGWAAGRRIDLGACEAALRDGFGAARSGEDAFDALMGLLAMLPFAEAPEKATAGALLKERSDWEGWILGR